MRYKYKAYVFDLPGATLIYRYTVLELVSRGYKFSEAKTLVRNSVFFAQVKKCSWPALHVGSEKEWADFVVEEKQTIDNLEYIHDAAIQGLSKLGYSVKAAEILIKKSGILTKAAKASWAWVDHTADDYASMIIAAVEYEKYK